MIFENSYWICKWICQLEQTRPFEGEAGVWRIPSWLGPPAGRKGHQSRGWGVVCECGLSGDWPRNLPWGGMQRSGSPPGWSDHYGVSKRQGKVLLSSPTNSDQVVFLGNQLVPGELYGGGDNVFSSLQLYLQRAQWWLIVGAQWTSVKRISI